MKESGGECDNARHYVGGRCGMGVWRCGGCDCVNEASTLTSSTYLFGHPPLQHLRLQIPTATTLPTACSLPPRLPRW